MPVPRDHEAFGRVHDVVGAKCECGVETYTAASAVFPVGGASARIQRSVGDGLASACMLVFVCVCMVWCERAICQF
jgi:hypothetical protein